MSYDQPWASPEPDDVPADWRDPSSGITRPRANAASGIPGTQQPTLPKSTGAIPKASRTKLGGQPGGNVMVRKTTTTTVDRGARGTSRRVETIESVDTLPPRRQMPRQGPPPDSGGVRRLVAMQDPRIQTSRTQQARVPASRVQQPTVPASRMQDPRRQVSGMQQPSVSRMQDPRMQDPRMQDPRMQDPRMQVPRMQDPRMQDPRMQDPRMQDPRMQDPRMQDPRMQAPRASTGAVKKTSVQTIVEPGRTVVKTYESTSGPAPTRMQPARAQAPRLPDPRMQASRMQAPRSMAMPSVVKKTDIQTTERDGRTVKVVKTSESTTGPGPSGLSRAIPPPSRITRPIPAGALSRSVKVVKSTTSVESGSSGLRQPVYQKRTKIVESSTSVESAASARPAQPRPGVSRIGMQSARPPPQKSLLPPSKIMSRRKGEGPDPRELAVDVEKELRSMALRAPGKNLKASGGQSGMVAPPTIMTSGGPVLAAKKVVSKKSVIRVPGQPEIIARGLTGIQTICPGSANKSEIEIQKLSSKVKTPDSVVDREVINVTSSVAIGSGFIETTRTVSYDAPEPPPKKPQMSPQQVARLVAEENADIDIAKDLLMPELQASRPVTYPVKRNVELELLHHISVSMLEDSVIPLVTSADEEQEEPQPEMIATIMSTEERGLTMASPPGNIYNYLFSDEKTEPVMDVSSAAPAPLQDIVIPLTLQDQSQEMAMTPGVLQAGLNLRMRMEEPVPEDMYVETVGHEMPKSKNTARKGTTKRIIKGPLLTSQIPPWGIKDVQPVVDLVGAPPAGIFVTLPEEDTDEVVEPDPAADGIEYLLQMEPPTHSSRVQLRGSQNPSWFPGYYLALPKIPDVMTVVKSPSIVFASAWKATHPDIFAEESMIVV